MKTLFPKAVFLHCRRDLRDVALSCWMTDFRSMSWPSQTTHIAARFKQYRRLMDHWQRCCQRRSRVDYEATVRISRGIARRLVEVVRARVGAGLPRIPPQQAPGANRQLGPGAPAGLQELGRPLEALRSRARRPLRIAAYPLKRRQSPTARSGGRSLEPDDACFVTWSRRHDCANRVIRLRNVVSNSSGDGGRRAPASPATDTKPNQVKRTGQCETSAARLNRSSTRKAQTTPQLSRNQNQSRSQVERASRTSSGARARDCQGEGQRPADPRARSTARRAAGQPVGDSARYSRMKTHSQSDGRQSEARGQVVGHRDRRPAIHRRSTMVRRDEAGASDVARRRRVWSSSQGIRKTTTSNTIRTAHAFPPGVRALSTEPSAARSERTQRYVNRSASGRPVASGSVKRGRPAR